MKESKRNARYFGESISALIKLCAESGYGLIDTPMISESLGIKKRRLYDVVNVLNVTGCLEKVDLLQIKWIGINAFPIKYREYANSLHVFDASVTLAEIVPSEPNISISAVTKDFLILYIAMNTQILNIRKVASYITRDVGNSMNVLNKLYQLTHILHSAGFLSRTDNIGEFKLNDEYFFTDTKEMLSLNSLLNRPIHEEQKPNYFARRRQEFEDSCAQVHEMHETIHYSSDNE